MCVTVGRLVNPVGSDPIDWEGSRRSARLGADGRTGQFARGTRARTWTDTRAEGREDQGQLGEQRRWRSSSNSGRGDRSRLCKAQGEARQDGRQSGRSGASRGVAGVVAVGVDDGYRPLGMSSPVQSSPVRSRVSGLKSQVSGSETHCPRATRRATKQATNQARNCKETNEGRNSSNGEAAE
jgi:hypothetical protein